MDETFQIIWHTATLTDVIGYENIVGRNAVEFVHPDDVGMVLDLLIQFNQSLEGRPQDGPAFRPDPGDIRVLTAAGSWLPLEATAYDHSTDPAIRACLVICKVITDRSDLGRSIELLGTGADVHEVLPLVARLADRSMGTDSRCALAWWSGDDVCVTWSPDAPMPDPSMADAARTALRAGVTDALTTTDFHHPMLNGAGGPAASLGYTVANLVPIVAPTGNEVIGCLLGWGHQTVELTLHPQLPLHTGLRVAALAIMDSRTKRELRWAASHDPLTLLSNRAEFASRLAAMDGENIALLYIDLDDFKPINDVHGHRVGDVVLVEVAARISHTVGVTGVAGRLGGDEFAIACDGLGADDGWALADRLVKAIRRPIRVGDITVAVGASIGVAMGKQPLIPSLLIHRADEALLAAKQAGKNTVKIAA